MEPSSKNILHLKAHFHIALFSFFVLVTNPQVHSQENSLGKIGSKSAYAEKIYLQLSSTVFTTDNTIWFKAIVTDFAHLPTKISSVLHVELIDFDKRIIDKKLLKLDYGKADSFFDLNEELPPGRYMVRAYTQWNKNFDSAFISQTYIDIYAAKKVSENEEAIRNITLTETAPNQFELSAKAYPNLLNPKYKGKLKMYIHTDKRTDSVEIKKGADEGYTFQYVLPKDVIKARMELKLDSVKLRNNNLGHVSSYSKTVAVNKNFLDLQFFPEGGKLVDGLTSTIGFKALDYNNNGKEVNGYIVDQDSNIIMPFQSNTLGMGTTYLTPDIQKTYYASVKGKDGIEYKYELPKANPTGVVIKVKELQEYIIITLNSKDPNQEELHVKAQARGVEYDSFYLPFKKGVANTGIEKSMFPEGIIKFTITNKQNQIVAERLFFNFKEEERININATPHLKHYRQRDKTVLNLTTKDKESNAIKTNLSVLVVNKEQLGSVNDARSNILSYFLLDSELKGNIETPSYYFNPNNQSRKHDMDALLLTQGWSNYKYENTEFSTDFEFLPEIGLSISGKVKDIWFSKRELKKPVELTAVYGPLNVATQQVDSTGYFNMYLNDYYKDEFDVVLQTKNEKGKKQEFTIELDEHESPIINYHEEERVYSADSVNVYVEQSIARKQAEEDLKVADGTIALDEVKLDGYNLTPQRQKMMDLHGPPDLVIENKELISEAPKWNSGLFSALQASFPDDVDVSDAGGFLQAKLYGSNFTFIVIDGVPVTLLDYPYIQSLPIEEIKSFELIKHPKNANYYINEVFREPFGEEEIRLIGPIPNLSYNLKGGLDGIGLFEDRLIRDPKTSIISIYTYAGKGFNYVSNNKGIDRFSVQGFTPKREFYAPKYETDDINDWKIPDLRSVVHWSPNVDTDEEGHAKVEFYNADNIGDMLVIIEGITNQGNIGYFETTYSVDKKL
ncbi:hypothetical protein ACFSKN_07240 [Mariniflexile gromovii]|uniref:TonB-dependent receptor-like protein n=1 Tax=Mariniflexile gromovii TaxID=362523 RepID=A0ABS4BQD0_9FLAO|nr:hypothetical protein [Mariniflexile gromovii]MBP0902798.1 hypothetical protein [Mariniflexile gromovii]